MNGTGVKTLKLQGFKKRIAYLTYGFTALIAILFIAVVSTFDGIAYQLLVFILGLAFLAVALFKNMASETPSTELPHQTIRTKVETFFPNLTIEKVKHWKDQNGSSSILLQITGRDINDDHVKSKVIRKFIKNHFNADYVVIELL